MSCALIVTVVKVFAIYNTCRVDAGAAPYTPNVLHVRSALGLEQSIGVSLDTAMFNT
jgi:hypothetical protein